MNTLTTVWFRPRESARDASGPEPLLLRLAIVWAWGAAYALERAMFEGKMPHLSFGMRLSFPLIIGLFGGAFYFWALSIAIDLTSSWFKGGATLRQIRRALVVGAIPKAFSLGFFVLFAVVLGHAFFDGVEDFEALAITDLAVSGFAATAILVLTGWSVIATSKALAEVQGFKSAWKAWLHTIVAFLCLVVVLAIPVVLWILVWKN
jgi:hypothetical protein